MIRSNTFRWRLILAIRMGAPAVVSILGLAGVFLPFLCQTEFLPFNHGNAPEDYMRLIGTAAVILMNLAALAIMRLLMIDGERRMQVWKYSVHLLEALSLSALGAIAVAFAVLDMTFCVGESKEAVQAGLALGLVAAAPLFFHRTIRVRRLLAMIAVYSAFACWIVVQRDIDWNMRRHFLRAYSQIHPGMTKEQVEDVVHQQFRGKRPVARFDKWGAQYTLDPDDGRFNSECIVIRMIDGKVSWTEYVPD